MDLLKYEIKPLNLRRHANKNLSVIFTPVEKPPKQYLDKPSFHSDKILDLVRNYPHWGAIKLSTALRLEGISLSPQSIYRFLVKHNLNRSLLRKSWKNRLNKSEWP